MSRLILYVRVDEERANINCPITVRYNPLRVSYQAYHRWHGRSSAGASYNIGTSGESCTEGIAHFHHKSYGSGDSRDTHD